VGTEKSKSATDTQKERCSREKDAHSLLSRRAPLHSSEESTLVIVELKCENLEKF
jgi:hypothetical protein